MPSDVRRVPQQDRARKSVDAILEATAELLGGGAPSEVTMSAIGAEAGISKAAIYRYFPDRGAVMRALANRYLAQLDEYIEVELAAIQTVDDAVACFSRMIDRFHQLMIDEPGLRTIWITGFNSAELGSLTLETADRLAARFLQACEHVLANTGEATERRFALAVHMCRAAIEMALHRGDSGEIIVDEFKRIVYSMARPSQTAPPRRTQQPVPVETGPSVEAAPSVETQIGVSSEFGTSPS